MAESTVGGGSMGAPWFDRELREVFNRASLLLVEDDPDIRELIVTLLELAGFEVTACGSAEGALEELREQPFDMVLTDYMLPHRTGAWLLEEAAREGLLDATPVLVVSAHPNPPVNGFEVLQKPFDLDTLVDKVRQRLDLSSKRPKLPSSIGVVNEAPAQAGGGGGGGAASRPEPVDLVLYVSAHSPRSAHAIENIRRVVERFAPDRVRLTIHDLAADPSKGAADAVAFTPTLVMKRPPGPRTFILGHISDPEMLSELLEGYGEELMARRPRPSGSN
jgi:DNA-binding response OmpR family regulator